MAALFSTLATTAEQWTRPDPDHGTLSNTLGHAAGSNRAVTAAGLVSSAVHSPIVVAFQLTVDPTNIYIGYNPTVFPADLHNATPFDGLVHVMVGDNVETAMGMVLEASTFARANNFGYYRRDYITGPNGYTNAAGAVREFQYEAAGAAAADTDEYQCRRFVILPASIRDLALTNAVDGAFSLEAFNAQLLEPEIASAVAARIDAVAEVTQFWRACHHHPAGDNTQRAVGTARLTGARPADLISRDPIGSPPRHPMTAPACGATPGEARCRTSSP